MQFIELPLAGAFLVLPQRQEDARGFFARTFCREAFAAQGLAAEFVQCSTSFNARRGTLRGMHCQRAPFEEVKLVRCTHGRIFDVVLDLRRESNTFRHWHAVELSARNGHALYIPQGFAHGFQTLEDASEVFYQISVPYHAPSVAGVRWDDPAFAIDWPERPPILSERDAGFGDWGERLCA